MKSKRLLTAMGQIDEQFIEEYLQSIPAAHTRIRSSRLVLAAAISALMLFLLGCAWAALHLDDLQISRKVIPQTVYNSAGEDLGIHDVPHNVLALNGIRGSANYQATAEWYAFIQEFDPDNTLQNEYYSRSDAPKYPEVYSAYWPYDQKMVDKLDELAAKYDLKLLGKVQQFQHMPEFLKAVGLSSLLREDSAVRLRFQNGHRYDGGNFGLVFELEPIHDADEWPDFLFGTFNCYRKDNLITSFLLSEDAPDSEEWNCVTPSGRNLLVISTPSDYGTSVFCDRDDATLVLTLSTLQKPQGDVQSTPLTREQIEAVLQSFDFDLVCG